jgi:hypothetical protein
VSFKPRVWAAAALKNYLAQRGNEGLDSEYALAFLLVAANGLSGHTPKPLQSTVGLNSPFLRTLDAALGHPDLFPGWPGHLSLEDLIPHTHWDTASPDELRSAAVKIAKAHLGAVDDLVRNESDHTVSGVEKWGNVAREFDRITDHLKGNPWEGPKIAGPAATPWATVSRRA